MMEENQEQRYVCKFCNKRCFSGKSLGGHMRGHLALISAARKGKQKALSNMDLEGGDHSSYVLKDELPNKNEKISEQSKSSLKQEKFKFSEMELEDGEEDGYGLRENPKKSWKISDLKHAASRKRNHCKECGKGFPSVRALAGHMRCHPLREREKFPCKKCNKGFDSMRALFGHMKCHPKRSRLSDEPAEILAEFTTLCPIKKKRSRIRYKPSPNLSFSSLNASSSSSFVTETEEVEDVAMCLMMLSRGVRNWDGFNAITVSSNNKSVIFEADSFDHYMGIAKNAGDFNSDETCKMENLREKLDSGISFTGNALSEDVITSAIGDVDSGYASGNENFEWEVSLDAYLSSGKFKKLKQDKSEIGLDDVDIRKDPDSTEVGLWKNLIPSVRIDQADLEFVNFDPCKNLSSADHDPRFWGEPSDEINYVVTDSEILEAEKKPEYKCKTCGQIFNSHQALGGHQSKHKMISTSSALSMERILQSDVGAISKLDSPDCFDYDPFEPEATERVITNFESLKSKHHLCPICFRVFRSGQALGGHKRAHYVGFTESKTKENLKTNQELLPDIQMGFGLDHAVTADGGPKDNVDNKLWRAASSHEHEALVVSN